MFNKTSKVNFTTAFISEFSPYRGYQISDNMIVLTRDIIQKGEETILHSDNKIFVTTIVNPKTKAEVVFVSTYDSKNNVVDAISDFCSNFTKFNDFVFSIHCVAPENTVIKGKKEKLIAVKHHYVMKGM